MRPTRRGGDGIVLIDAAFPGAGATGRNAGFLLAESDCFATTARKHGVDIAHALRAAGIRSRAIVNREARGAAGRQIELSPTGSVRLASDRREAADFVASAKAIPAARRPRKPAPEAGRSQAYLAALVDGSDGMLDPLGLLDLLLFRGAELGVRRCDQTPLLELQRQSGHVVARTPCGTIRAQHVVLAVGAAARLVLPRAARKQRPVRAQALVARVDPAPDWPRPTYATRGGDYWRTLADGRVLLGGMRRVARREESTRSESPTDRIQSALDGLLRELAGPDAHVDVERRWAGTMAFTLSGVPWAGPVPRRKGLSLVAGMNGHGMGWGPGLAAQVAERLAGVGPGPNEAFRPGR